MKIVIDTNVVASAIFFGGKPLKLIKMLLENKVNASATPSIVMEYYETTNYLLSKYNGKDLNVPITQIVSQMDICADTNDVHICRDPDDDKFLSCAKNSKAYYIVSGDKDLLTLKQLENIHIVTVSEFFEIFDKKN